MQEMNKKIAKILGRCCDGKCRVCGKSEDRGLHWKYGPDMDNPRKHEFVPRDAEDFCYDLNLMHEAEASLSDDEWITYIEALKSLCNGHAGTYRGVKAIVNASAEIRAEAFLWAKGK